MASLDWNEKVRPVLAALYRVVERTGPREMVDSEFVLEELGWDGAEDNERLDRILDNLYRAGYVDGSQVGTGWTFLRLKEPALRIVAGWPGAVDDQTAARLIELVAERMHEEADPDEQTKLRRLRDGLLEVSTGVLTGVLTDLARGI
jgi:hypothetical protein